jgi:predicted RNase H-like HicB family nuclease
VFVEDSNGDYNVFVEEFPGVTSRGKTLEEARENLRNALEKVLVGNKAFVEKIVAEGQKVFKEPYELIIPSLARDVGIPGEGIITCDQPTVAGDLLEFAGAWQGDDLDACLEAVYATRQTVQWETE